MLPWLNFMALFVSTLLMFGFYVRSVSPAARERREGPIAYARCARDRIIASVLEFLAFASYVVYLFYPLPVGLPSRFPWPWFDSGLIALVIGVPSAWLMIRGLRDAGEEALIPRKEHPMYGGIYERIRHPQATGELPLCFCIALLCHSPFLVLYSLVWVPIFYLMSKAEERDLLIRFGDAYAEYMRRTGFWWPRRRRGS